MSNQLARFAEIDTSTWGIMREQAQVLSNTGFLPEGIKTPEQALAIIMKGRELGLPPMYALSNISIIKGKPVCGAELLSAVIYRDHGDNAVRILHSDAESCVIAYKRRGWSESQEFSFTIQEAKQAGLTNNPTWSKYPQAMLRARCISAVARASFADSIGGMYTPEEMGATVNMAEDGGLVIDDAPARLALVPDEPEIIEAEPEPQLPPKATQAELDAYNKLVDRVTLAGKLKDGKPHKHAEAGVESDKLSFRRHALQKWLNQYEADLLEKARQTAEEIGEAGWKEGVEVHPTTLSEGVHAVVAHAAIDKHPEETERIFGDGETPEAKGGESAVDADIEAVLDAAQKAGFEHGGDLSYPPLIEAINAAKIQSIKGPIATLDGLGFMKLRVLASHFEMGKIAAPVAA